MDAFGAQVMAFRTVVPTTAEEQWQQVTSLAGMLLQISPVDKENLRVLANSLQIVAEEPRRYLIRKIELGRTSEILRIDSVVFRIRSKCAIRVVRDI